MVDWPMLREDPNVVILFSVAKQLKEWVDEVHGMSYLIAGNYLSISLLPDLGVGNSQSASPLVAPGPTRTRVSKPRRKRPRARPTAFREALSSP